MLLKLLLRKKVILDCFRQFELGILFLNEAWIELFLIKVIFNFSSYFLKLLVHLVLINITK